MEFNLLFDQYPSGKATMARFTQLTEEAQRQCDNRNTIFRCRPDHQEATSSWGGIKEGQPVSASSCNSAESGSTRCLTDEPTSPCAESISRSSSHSWQSEPPPPKRESCEKEWRDYGHCISHNRVLLLPMLDEPSSSYDLDEVEFTPSLRMMSNENRRRLQPRVCQRASPQCHQEMRDYEIDVDWQERLFLPIFDDESNETKVADKDDHAHGSPQCQLLDCRPPAPYLCLQDTRLESRDKFILRMRTTTTENQQHWLQPF